MRLINVLVSTHAIRVSAAGDFYLGRQYRDQQTGGRGDFPGRDRFLSLAARRVVVHPFHAQSGDRALAADSSESGQDLRPRRAWHGGVSEPRLLRGDPDHRDQHGHHFVADAVDVAGHGNHQPRSTSDRRCAGRRGAFICWRAGGGVVGQPWRVAATRPEHGRCDDVDRDAGLRDLQHAAEEMAAAFAAAGVAVFAGAGGDCRVVSAVRRFAENRFDPAEHSAGVVCVLAGVDGCAVGVDAGGATPGAEPDDVVL